MMLTFLNFALAAEPWVGLPLDRAEALGAVPSLSRTSEGLKLALPSGFATLVVAATVAEADLAFDGMARTSATRWPSPGEGLPGDRAIGDGLGLVLVRDRNAVLLVRDPEGRAAAVARGLLATLTTDVAACAPVAYEAPEAGGGTVRWDRCGRRLR